jgi:hypothetical protein
VHIENAPFDLTKLVTSTAKVLLPQARFKGLRVDIEIEPAAARWFIGDSHHTRQVLLNLLANAVKFTERGCVVVRAMRIESETQETRVRIEVKDTGIGIPEGKQAAIFEPFTQADDSITRVYGGTGLGTTIARQLVNLMGGEIGLESSVGQGSCFWFEVPLLPAQPGSFEIEDPTGDSSKVRSPVAALATPVTGSCQDPRGHESSLPKIIPPINESPSSSSKVVAISTYRWQWRGCLRCAGARVLRCRVVRPLHAGDERPRSAKTIHILDSRPDPGTYLVCQCNDRGHR